MEVARFGEGGVIIIEGGSGMCKLEEGREQGVVGEGSSQGKTVDC